jgi:CheY-like chemotaxis protein
MPRFDGPGGPSAASGPDLSYAYVLVADADIRRATACVREAAKAFGVAILIARDGDEALGIIGQFGPPRLLITDLSLPLKDGFALIETIERFGHRRTPIIAWSATREIREFAMHRLSQLDAKVLGPSVAPEVIRSAVIWARRIADESTSAVSAPAAAATVAEPVAASDDVERRITALAEEARQVTGASGAAVYLRAPGDTHFRASVSWTSDAPMPPSPELLPRVFEQILQTGEAIVMPDVAAARAGGEALQGFEETVRGFAAIPILAADGEIVGAIFTFDVVPLTLSDENVAALKALGRRQLLHAPSVAPRKVDEVQPRLEPPVSAAGTGSFAGRVHDETPALLDRASAWPVVMREVSRARREQLPLSVILFDAHAVGEDGGMAHVDAFRSVGATLFKVMRGSDLAIRWSDHQLLVVITGLSEGPTRQVAERLRAAMQAGSANRLVVSGAVGELARGETFDALAGRVAERIDIALARGGNRIA